MKTRTLLIAFTFVPLGCVMFGLTFHYLYLTAAVDHAAEQALRPVLEQRAGRIAEALRRSDAAGDASVFADVVQRVHVALPGPDGGPAAMLVDETWRVVQLGPAEDQVATVGELVAWSRPPRMIAGQPTIGWLKSAVGERLAAVHSLGEGRGFVLTHGRLGAVQIDPRDVRAALVPALGIALVWTAGLLAVCVYLLVSYFQQDAAGKKDHRPEVEALRQTQALLRTQETVIFGLAKLSDSRDPETGDHLERISHYSSALAGALRQHPDFRDVVTPSYVRLIGLSSALHDIGKVGVEDAILRKPGALLPEERNRMKQHALIGGDCLREIERRLGTSNFLQMAREIACSHHEWWDGCGYPDGLAGENIPLSARIVAIADVYDALSSRRVYKSSIPHEDCVLMIAEEAGTHFDPRLVDVFVQIQANFRQIAERYADPSPSADVSATPTPPAATAVAARRVLTTT